ncbi:MAG: NapC/NirT family cytochrome c [Actinomycetota bacterium]|nr:NapC/NirT family cytochrome c [Actinomycetota bacterium]
MKLDNLLSSKRVSIVLVAFLLIGGLSYAGYEATSTSQFCRSCHVMEDAYQSWYHSAHRSVVVSCTDCHMPKSLGYKLVYKVTSGTRDIYKNIAGPPDVIKAKEETIKIVNENCKRCHAKMVAKINMNGRRCTDCHRYIPHGASLAER